ncbi:phage major capsid protein [Corallococcus sp. CA047B]|uniref:phage major capsid protein n=1 Tax=Corallococcus sp. CA047B TaxID=2316729 RepID=UPI000EA18113|nr:phage major capsid protein [Corallococcus sp. CA047B]RKH09001.1 phage major capsid protein [Corallococcus sp. CA047B]
MATPNLSEIITTTLESRSGRIADNVTKNNALLTWLKKRGNQRTVSGGRTILEELSFAENGNGGWYSGYDVLPMAPQDVLSSAEYSYKQYAVPVVISGLEQLQNSGKEAIIDLMEARLKVAESTMANAVAQGLYSDGTGFGGKQLTGLDAAVPVTPTTGTYGGIDRAVWAFWRPQVVDMPALATKDTIQPAMNTLWSSLVRGSDQPDLIVAGNAAWATYMASLQAFQRFTDTSTASLGFTSVKFLNVDVVLDGGIGGFAGTNTMYFLNTSYLHYRPHKDRNMVPLEPGRRTSFNQDASAQILAWAGNLTCSGAQFQGRLIAE